jgi:hypothetical protein
VVLFITFRLGGISSGAGLLLLIKPQMAILPIVVCGSDAGEHRQHYGIAYA